MATERLDGIDPDRQWRYVEPHADGHREVVMTEQQILDEYFEFWSGKLASMGRAEHISLRNCLMDWVVVHWAEPVDRPNGMNPGGIYNSEP